MNTTVPSPARSLAGLRSRRMLTPEGLGPAELAILDGRYTGAGAHAGPVLDAGDLLVLPGIVDLHGDAFERAVMPRPQVAFPYDAAMLDVDRQLLANGITTAFHGVTLSWEGGLRGRPYAERLLDTLARLSGRMGARHRVHLRFEVHCVDGVPAAQSWIEDGRIGFLAFNNHLPSMVKRLGDERKLLQYADRAECDIDTFRSRIQAAAQASGEVDRAMRELAATAEAAGLRIASHDDPDSATRRYYHELGCSVAEFPTSMEAACTARELGDVIVFGSPNVMRGGSHIGAPGAADMVRAGLCDILTTDYYYAAPLAAAFRLAAEGIAALEQAWPLISRNPARAAGLQDVGELAAGQCADAILVDDSDLALPRVCAAIVGGRLHHASRLFDLRAAPARALVLSPQAA